MSLASVICDEQKYLVPTYDRQKVLFAKGRGVYLWDSQGNRYLDFLSGIGVNALGHGHPAIQGVLKKQAGKMLHVSNLFYHQYQADLAKQLTKLSGLDRAFFCNSGTEAWEGALKFARAYARSQNSNGHGPKTQILSMENSFHGRTFGALTTTASAKYRDPFAPLLPGVNFVRFNDVADLKNKFDDSVCAIGVETIQGEGGIHPVSAEFLQIARDLANRTGALLILDEIQCGLGRTGRHFAYQHYGIQPDIVTVAKPLAAGLPLGAILTTNRVASAMHPGLHGTTFGGGPLACAVAIEFLKQMDGLLPHVSKIGAYFLGQLEALKAQYSCVKEVRGLGVMLGMDLDSADVAKAVAAQMFRKKILINRTHDTVLRFLPPYIIEKKHIDLLIETLDGALKSALRNLRPSQEILATRSAS
jgi:acetylornithine aminotransferase/acetylornithine/N-succinyldiaminopimelate aminotransferase